MSTQAPRGGQPPRITGTRLVVVLLAALVALDLFVAPASRIEHGLAFVQAAAEERQEAVDAEREQRAAERQREADERRRTVVPPEDQAAAGDADDDATRPSAAAVSLPADPAGATIAMINETRAAAGKPPLDRHDGIDRVARRWSQHMAERDEQYHNPDFPRQIAEVYEGLRSSAENVAHGRPGDLERIHQSFVDSPGHYENMIGDFTHVGVGVALTADGTVWVTHNFARR